MMFENIAGYKFLSLNDLDVLQDSFVKVCVEQQIKGTILLSHEGINISLSGLPNAIANFKTNLFSDERFADMTFRQSLSDFIAFKRLKVKIKKDIITLRHSKVKPEEQKAPSVSPHQFKKWLDENHSMLVLDTRNEYEINFGTFANAQHLKLNDFSEFKQTISEIPHDKPVVMFCTGGIRCEKAALELLETGKHEVYQLEGGILNYFAEVGEAHYQGDCFVFDERVALNPNLEVSAVKQCKICQGPVRQPFDEHCCTSLQQQTL